MSLQVKHGRPVRYQRPNAEWVGKVVCRIGKASGVVVLADNGKGKPKHVFRTDLRRTCTERLIAAGVAGTRMQAASCGMRALKPRGDIYAPGNVKHRRKSIRECLSVPRYNES